MWISKARMEWRWLASLVPVRGHDWLATVVWKRMPSTGLVNMWNDYLCVWDLPTWLPPGGTFGGLPAGAFSGFLQSCVWFDWNDYILLHQEINRPTITTKMAHSWRLVAFKQIILWFQADDSIEQGPKNNPQCYLDIIGKIELVWGKKRNRKSRHASINGLRGSLQSLSPPTTME